MITTRSTSATIAAVFTFAVVLGTITDRTTGQPLNAVAVAIGTSHAKTRADGSYRLTGLKPGHATVNVSSDDVPPQQFEVTIHAKTTRADFKVCSTTLDYNCGAPQ